MACEKVYVSTVQSIIGYNTLYLVDLVAFLRVSLFLLDLGRFLLVLEAVFGFGKSENFRFQRYIMRPERITPSYVSQAHPL